MSRGVPGSKAPHGGNGSRYSTGCRCAACRRAHKLRLARRQAERIATRPTPSFVVHGKAGTYVNWGCRCAPCSAAQSTKNAAKYRDGKKEKLNASL